MLTHLCNFVQSGTVGWWFPFIRRGTRRYVSTTRGSHSSAFIGRSTPGHWRVKTGSYLNFTFKSFKRMWFSFWPWDTGPVLYPCVDVWRGMRVWSTWRIWRRVTIVVPQSVDTLKVAVTQEMSGSPLNGRYLKRKRKTVKPKQIQALNTTQLFVLRCNSLALSIRHSRLYMTNDVSALWQIDWDVPGPQTALHNSFILSLLYFDQASIVSSIKGWQIDLFSSFFRVHQTIPLARHAFDIWLYCVTS